MLLISILKLFSRNCYLEKQFSESGPARSKGRAQHHVVVVEGVLKFNVIGSS